VSGLDFNSRFWQKNRFEKSTALLGARANFKPKFFASNPRSSAKQILN